MRVEVLGDGPPEVAIVGGVHGDEPCGVRAVERLLAEPPPVERAVKLIVANERAIEAGVRYVDEDLNRVFPGDEDADTHESRLAVQLAEELDGLTVLALHSTQSYPAPFAVVQSADGPTRRLYRRLPVDAVVETEGFVNGRLFEANCELVEVECGLQRSEQATENAVRLCRAFLAAADVLPGAAEPRDVPAFRLTRSVPKEPASEYEVCVENFQPVAAGEQFAAVDGRPVVADEPFYPVLLSANGYEERFGYAAQRTGLH